MSLALDIRGFWSRMDSMVIVETTELISTAMFTRSSGLIFLNPVVLGLFPVTLGRLRANGIVSPVTWRAGLE